MGGANGWGKHYDPAIAQTIARKGIWVSPTVNLNWKRHLSNPPGLEAIQSRFRKMKSAGCKLMRPPTLEFLMSFMLTLRRRC